MSNAEESSRSFARTFESTRAELKRYAARIVKSQDTAEDIVQDVFAWIWLHWKDVELMENVRGYLYQATRARSLNRLRDDHNAARLATRYTGPELVEEPETEAALLSAEISRAVERVVQHMPPRRREVVSLRLQGRLSQAEIAAKLGITIKGVERHLTLAIKTLRDELPALLGEERQ